jgi:DNA-binding transcriptional MerR regulator
MEVMASSAVHKERLMKVGELSARSGKTVRALRFYEEMELLNPVERTSGGFRMYDENALLRIHWIDRLQELGFSLRETRSFMDNLRSQSNAPAAMRELQNFYVKKLVETREQMTRLNGLVSELEESLQFLESCQGCSPGTPRQACACCDEVAHQDSPTPRLVAAVHEFPIDPTS